MRCFAAIRATGRGSALDRIVLNRTLARMLPPLGRFGSSMQRHAYVGLPAYAAALGGMTAVQIERPARSFLARERLRLSVVLPAVLARGSAAPRPAAMARSAHGSGRGPADQGGPDQHGPFLGSAAAAPRSPAGGVHAERRPCAAGRRARPTRQAPGTPADGSRDCRRDIWSGRSRDSDCRCIAGSRGIRACFARRSNA